VINGSLLIYRRFRYQMSEFRGVSTFICYLLG